uniref:Uncharacterized protein n=1 Tax=Grammatophora oceanica TaxID=210454 RepID=A0A7S1VDG7_9STRA|eukprot:CAMPEP_0194048238 /NCGR_PEP_ID=MMETSP0009_2-20130614/26804_1 /TAXON_ID=210454 /ORGANISM="Grammatophora oceanica, Strain CCMP 410" /LENGTH=173 /DNA_ID=CAMNT_0038694059 /DNA_START=53 /DNA_END=574 /DNA_ORIENTATION=+
MTSQNAISAPHSPSSVSEINIALRMKRLQLFLENSAATHGSLSELDTTVQGGPEIPFEMMNESARSRFAVLELTKRTMSPTQDEVEFPKALKKARRFSSATKAQDCPNVDTSLTKSLQSTTTTLMSCLSRPSKRKAEGVECNRTQKVPKRESLTSAELKVIVTSYQRTCGAGH